MGKRGPKKGAKYAPTISKEQAREAVRQIVLKHMDRMVRSQVANATGIGHLFTRDKSGKFTRIEDEARAIDLLENGKEGADFFIFMKDPSVQAFTDLLNRALDKPKEQEQELRITGELEMVAPKLVAARKRLALKA